MFFVPYQIHIVKPVRGNLKRVITAAATKSKNGELPGFYLGILGGWGKLRQRYSPRRQTRE